MILYKYYGYDAGLSALRSRQLGFRCPNNFNDPLELTFPLNVPDDRVQRLLGALETLRKWVVVLSLTESPLDPLMWAHYGHSHRGFVLGYDVSEPFLESDEYNLITARDGKVAYASPSGADALGDADDSLVRELLLSHLGAPQDVEPSHELKSLAKRVLLTKHPRWATEREVRVVKLMTSLFHTAEEYQADPLRGFSMPSHLVAPSIGVSIVPGLYLYNHRVQIVEVYLGARNPLREMRDSNDPPADRSLVQDASARRWRVHQVFTTGTSWDLVEEVVGCDALAITDTRASTQVASLDADTARLLQAKLATERIDDSDTFEVTKWSRVPYLKKNGHFL